MTLNAKRISLARNLRGVSQGELSQKLKLTNQSVLSNIENGKIPFDEPFATQLANELKLPVSFFHKDRSFTRLSKFYYRKRNAFPAAALIPLEAKIDVIRESYSRLLEAADVPFVELPAIPVTDSNRPEEIARLFRLFLGLNNEPLDGLVSIIERLGIVVFFLDVNSDKFSGLTVQTDNNVHMIVINKNMPNDHKKFTLAHEIGHIIMHIPFAEDPDFISEYDLDVVEKQADQFAGAFLIPREQAKYTLRDITYSKLDEFKTYWKVSKQAIICRARDVGIINEVRFKTLFIELSRNGERKKERITIPLDEPKLLKKIIEAYEAEYSRKEIAEDIMGISENDFIDWFGFEKNKLKIVLK